MYYYLHLLVVSLKVIVTIGFWLYFFPVILNPNNVPFRFLL
ncbi:transporter, partial [Bacillus sp. AKBS9]